MKAKWFYQKTSEKKIMSKWGANKSLLFKDKETTVINDYSD